MNPRASSRSGSDHNIVGHIGPTRLATTSAWTAIVVLGLVMVTISIPLAWTEAAVFGEDRSAAGIPLDFLRNPTPADLDAVPIMWLLVGALALGLAGLVFTSGRWAIVLGGLLSIVVALATVMAIRTRLREPRIRTSADLFDCIGVGIWVAVIGGILLAIGGSMSSRASR